MESNTYLITTIRELALSKTLICVVDMMIRRLVVSLVSRHVAGADFAISIPIQLTQ
jgi:hypothetical protein